MPSLPPQPFTLTSHPATPSAVLHRIAGHVTRQRDGTLAITYILEGDIERLRLPAPQAARFTDELWRHTCCELFVARKNDPAYHECNFAPSTEWAAYAFARTRERAPPAAQHEIAALNPRIALRRRADRLELDAVIRLDLLSSRYTDARIALAVSAVIEDRDGTLSYWALTHPQAKPDFHHPDAFVLELNEVRN